MFKQTENQAYINCNINECQCYFRLSFKILRRQRTLKESLRAVTSEESFSASFHLCVAFQFCILFLRSLSAGSFLLHAEYFLLVLKNNLYYLKMSQKILKPEKKKKATCLRRINDVIQLRNSG